LSNLFNHAITKSPLIHVLQPPSPRNLARSVGKWYSYWSKFHLGEIFIPFWIPEIHEIIAWFYPFEKAINFPYSIYREWVSKFQLYHGENKLIFNEMTIRSALYLTNTLSWIFIVLAHWNNSPRIDMLPHSNTLLCFRANQFLLFHLSVVCLAEKQQILIL